MVLTIVMWVFEGNTLFNLLTRLSPRRSRLFLYVHSIVPAHDNIFL